MAHNENDGFYNPDKGYEDKEMEGIIMGCLKEIPGEQRWTVIMKKDEGMKVREIAQTLDITESTAKSRLYYGLRAMRKQLEAKNIYKENAYGN